MKLWNTTRAMVLIAAMIGCSSAWAASSSLIEQGKEHFKAKRFYAAEDCFNRALQEDPQNQIIYFYLGQTLEQLYDSKAAKSAYTNGFRINPFNKLGVSTKEALIQLNGRVEADIHKPSDDVKTTVKTVEMIRRQAADGRERYIRWGNAHSEHAVGMGNMAAARFGYEDPMTLNGVRRGDRMYDYYGANSANEVSGRSQIRSSWVRADAQKEALRHQSAALKAARELSASAANLEALLAEKPRPGGAKLRALGTQLYVRYYGNEDHEAPTPPEDPPIELKATELSWKGSPAAPTIASKQLSATPQSTESISLSQAAASILREKF